MRTLRKITLTRYCWEAGSSMLIDTTAPPLPRTIPAEALVSVQWDDVVVFSVFFGLVERVDLPEDACRRGAWDLEPELLVPQDLEVLPLLLVPFPALPLPFV